MPSPRRRVLITLVTAGSVAVTGATALASAPGYQPVLSRASYPITKVAPSQASSLAGQVNSLLTQEKGLQGAIASARQRLAATVNQETAKENTLNAEAAQIQAQQAQINQEEAQLAAQRANIAQAAASTPAPTTHASTGASSAHSGGDDGGGDD